MRAVIMITVASLLTIATGCVSNIRDPRMTEVFRSQRGEAIMITPDQHAYVSYNGKRAGDMWWLGSIRADPQKPREAFLLTPSASPWAGSTFIFGSHYGGFAVYPYDW